ncbi:MAG: TonB-dependent receptor [Bacteroidota bacterium]
MKKLFVLIFLLLFFVSSFCQKPNQSIRGKVIDQDSKVPLIGATVELLNPSGLPGVTTDFDGDFILENVPVGRRGIRINYLGYEPVILPNLIVGSGKELVLTIEMQESLISLNEVVVTAKSNKHETLNEMTTLSGRSFSVEETQRYAASLSDPARMAQNYAGVSSSGDDLSNEIIIRGNSPSYVQWRLEGIQIPGPNHYSTKGSSGGGISMLSSSILADSDFYTGAFPADIGNALAGAFDLNFRTGNNQKRENSFQLGVIGLEASMEGPFSNSSKASYLVNYRYSALGLLQRVTDLDFGDAQINFQDLSFKINLPTKKAGVFSIFGLGGLSQSSEDRVTDTLQWQNNSNLFGYREKNTYALTGLTHRFLFPNQKTYIKTVVAGSLDRYENMDEFIDINRNFELVDDETEDMEDRVLRASVTLNHKSNARHSFRGGFVFSHMSYNFLNTDREISRIGGFQFEYSPRIIGIDAEGSTQMYQSFIMHKFRPTEKITINSGIHFTHFRLSNSSAVEPRLGVRWRFSPRQSVAFSAGLHSQAEHLINYTVVRFNEDGSAFQPNLDLGLTRSAHFVIGYDRSITDNIRIKIEAYYQNLFDVPTDTSFVAGSILNAENVYDVLYNSNTLTGTGDGRNIGIDLTLERFFSDGLYYLLTGSLFDSSFSGTDGKKFNTRYNSRFNLTLLAGKEFMVGKSKKNAFTINGKILYYGGNRYSEWDFDTFSLTENGFYKLQMPSYYRFDFSLNYRINKSSSTHSISLELQNLTNRKNIANIFPNFFSGTYDTSFQGGIIPNLNYRIEF